MPSQLYKGDEQWMEYPGTPPPLLLGGGGGGGSSMDPTYCVCKLGPSPKDGNEERINSCFS